MNEDLVAKIVRFIEFQCDALAKRGHCAITGCHTHWLAAQIRDRKFENLPPVRLRSSLPEPAGFDIRNIVEDRAKGDPTGGR